MNNQELTTQQIAEMQVKLAYNSFISSLPKSNIAKMQRQLQKLETKIAKFPNKEYLKISARCLRKKIKSITPLFESTAIHQGYSGGQQAERYIEEIDGKYVVKYRPYTKRKKLIN